MRPGREAPEYFEDTEEGRQQFIASMRPGREAPEYFPSAGRVFQRSACFNEAGARGPGILVAPRASAAKSLASMRPGREAPEYRSSWPLGAASTMLQ